MYRKTLHRKNDINDDFFDNMDNTKYWIMGLFSSDGYVAKEQSKSQVTIAQSGESGKNIIYFIKNIMGFTGHIIEQIPNISSTKAYILTFSSYKLKEIIKKYKVYNNIDSEYYPPPLDLNYIKPFVAGYLEGDGSIKTYDRKGSSKNYLMISICGNENFIKFLSVNLPEYSCCRKMSSSHLWEIRWYGTKAIFFGNWLYDFDMEYVSPKKNRFEDAKQLYYSSDNYRRAQEIKKEKEDFMTYLKYTDNSDIMKYSKENNIDFRKLYKWIKNWKKEKLVDYETNLERAHRQRADAIKYFKANPTSNKQEYCKTKNISHATLYRYLEGVELNDES